MCYFINFYAAVSTSKAHGIQEVSGSIPLISTKRPDFERNRVFFFMFYVFFGVFRTSLELDIFEEISNTYNATYNRNITKRDIKDSIEELFPVFLLCLIRISHYCKPLVFHARGIFYAPRFKRSAVCFCYTFWIIL